jgi:hypothetical protein
LADTAHDADDLPDYLADLAILLSGYQYRTGDQPGHVVRHAYCDGAKAGRLNRSADMIVLMLWEQSTQHFVILAGQVYDTGLG